MSGSSIVQEKIESLIVKFVRKCKGRRNHRKGGSGYDDGVDFDTEKQRLERADLAEQQKQLQQTIESNAQMLNSLGGFEMRALNPNLPLPPI